jgi:hypothetical protein
MNVSQIAPHQVQQWLKDGTDHQAVVRMLVASGAWTVDGANDIVQTCSAHESAPEQIEQLAWPGPVEEPPPLFA